VFRADHAQIRVGMIISSFAAGLLGPWVAAVAVYLKRIEGGQSPLTYLQLGFGMLLVLEFIFPMMIWETATFRIGRSDQLIQTLNDMAWIPFEAVTATSIIEAVAIGVAILRDHRGRSVFPRWVGYVNFWVAAGLAGGSLNVLVKNGPLAWPGILAWWIPLVAFAVWMTTMAFFMVRGSARGGEIHVARPAC
jgi:hypothetical protein